MEHGDFLMLPRLYPLLTALVLTLCGCGGAASSGPSRAGLRVVAAENFWGSIATQLAGSRATVQSVISNPASDPHSYEPTAADARALATSQLVLVNGIGYDGWAQRLLSANPTPGRVVVNVGELLGLKEGENPHRWYSPSDVEAVAHALTARLQRLDPRDAAYFANRLSSFDSRSLKRYRELIASIAARYGGIPVGASESIFALLSPALHLRLITPASFMKAISEGAEVTAADTATARRQITDHLIRVWIYNPQNATPEIGELNTLAREHGIPVATVTETLSPANARFQDWQVAEFEGIARALHLATGR